MRKYIFRPLYVYLAAFLPAFSLTTLIITLILEIDDLYLAWPVWFQYMACSSFGYVVFVSLLSRPDRLKLGIEDHFLVKRGNNLFVFVVFVGFSLIVLLPDSAAGSQIGKLTFENHRYIVKLERDEGELGHLRLLRCGRMGVVCKSACAGDEGSESLPSATPKFRIEWVELKRDTKNHTIGLSGYGGIICQFPAD